MGSADYKKEEMLKNLKRMIARKKAETVEKEDIDKLKRDKDKK